MKLSTLVAGGFAALALAAPAASQNWELPPTYGTAELTTGFQPDPHTVQLQAGGNIDASVLGAGCLGLIADAPDFDVVFEAGTLPLNIYVQSAEDTTLVVNAPDGNWYCNDDTNGLNPVLSFQNPQSGLYDIWVGSFGGVPQATLFISELPPQ